MGDYALPTLDQYLTQMEQYLHLALTDIREKSKECKVLLEIASEPEEIKNTFNELNETIEDAKKANAQSVALQEGLAEDNPDDKILLEKYKVKSEREYLRLMEDEILNFHTWAMDKFPTTKSSICVGDGIELGFLLAHGAHTDSFLQKQVKRLKEKLSNEEIPPLNRIQIKYNPALGNNQYIITLGNKRKQLGEIVPGKKLVLSDNYDDLKKISGTIPEKIYKSWVAWVSPGKVDELLKIDAKIVNPEILIIYDLEVQLKKSTL
jgi:hypothetical protein